MKSPRATRRRRPALPCGYEPPDYRVVPVRLADGTVLHVNADDLADPRYVNVRNLSPDGVPVPGRAGLQPRAVFHGAEVLGEPWYGTEYRADRSRFAEDEGHGRATGRDNGPDFVKVDPADVVEKLFQQAERMGVHLTPQVAEALSLGDPRVISYVADMITLMGGKPAVEPREHGGGTVEGKNYVVNEAAQENFRGHDGQVRPVGDGWPAVVQAQRSGVILPHQAELTHGAVPDYGYGGRLVQWTKPAPQGPRPPLAVQREAAPRDLVRNAAGLETGSNGVFDGRHIAPESAAGIPWQPPHWDNAPAKPDSLGGPMPVMPYTGGNAFQEGLKSPYFGEGTKKKLQELYPYELRVHHGDMASDWDGSPWAYGPENAPGKDWLGNGGHPGNWWALLTKNRKNASEPLVQGPSDPHPGGYISKTPLFADWKVPKDSDPERPKDKASPTYAQDLAAYEEVRARRKEADRLPGYFPDAEEVPYIAVPFETDKDGKVSFPNGRPGDFVTVVDNTTGKYLHGIAADSRTNERPEASIYMSRHFGLGDKGTSAKRFSYFVYNGSGGKNNTTNWPLTKDQINEKADFYKRITPEVQAAIDAGYARKAAHDPSPTSGRDFFPEVTQDEAHFGQVPAEGPFTLAEKLEAAAEAAQQKSGAAPRRQFKR